MNAPPIPLSRPADDARPRHDWTLDQVEALFDLPVTEMVFRAAEVHRRWFDPTELQLSPLLSAKTGGCPENCGYRGPSQHFKTAVPKLTAADTVIAAAKAAKALGLEPCATLGMLTPHQARALKAAGLDHDNHDLDPRPDHDKVVASWTRQDRHDPDASLLADLKMRPMSLATEMAS